MNKLSIAIVVALLAAGAAAQQNGSPRRAPLANTEDVEPAVQTGETRVALINPAAAAETAPVTPPTPPAAPAAPAIHAAARCRRRDRA